MRFDFKNEAAGQKDIEMLQSYGVWLKKDTRITKGQAWILLGEAILNRFIRDFVHVWKTELFWNCRLSEFQASEEELRERLAEKRASEKMKQKSEGCIEEDDSGEQADIDLSTLREALEGTAYKKVMFGDTMLSVRGKAILDIYAGPEKRYWCVTEKFQRDGSVYLSGCAWLPFEERFTEFQNLTEEKLRNSEKAWQVKREDWSDCPQVEVAYIEKKRISEEAREWGGDTQPSSSYLNYKEVKKMDQNMQAKLDKYMDLFEELKQKTNDERTALTLLQEVSKDRRMEEIREEREVKNSEPATTKQLKFMKKLGIDVPPGITKREASMLIDEELGRNGE